MWPVTVARLGKGRSWLSKAMERGWLVLLAESRLRSWPEFLRAAQRLAAKGSLVRDRLTENRTFAPVLWTAQSLNRLRAILPQAGLLRVLERITRNLG